MLPATKKLLSIENLDPLLIMRTFVPDHDKCSIV
jgi:hypothetical protein